MNYEDKVFILVEGASDARLFKKMMHEDAVDFTITHGKENLLGVLELVKRQGKRNKKLILAIKDADFDRILDTKYEYENLLLTDEHDIELTLLKSACLKDFLAEFSNTKKHSQEVLKILLESAKPLSLLRLINERDKLGLKFEELMLKPKKDYQITERGIELDLNRLIEKLISRSSTEISRYELTEKVRELEGQIYDLEQLSNGHDLMELLHLWMNKSRPKKNKKGKPKVVDKEGAESFFRAAYRLDQFQQTQLFRDLDALLKARKREVWLL